MDAQGQPVIYIQMCKGHIDGATLYHSDDDPAKEQILGQWDVSPAVDLKPGEVRYPDYGHDRLKTASIADFQKETCHQNWG